MAQKKNKKNSAPKVEGMRKEEKVSLTMQDKTEPVVEVSSQEYDSSRSIIKGIIKLLFLFLLLLGFIIVLAFGINRLFPGKSDDIAIPVIEPDDKERAVYTGDKNIKIQMTTDEDNASSMVMANGKRDGKYLEKEESGDYTYEKEFLKEGEYKIVAKTLKKGLIWKTSSESESLTVYYDTTAPSSDVVLKYDKNTDSKIIDLEGVAEAGSKVVVSDGAKNYETTSDENGNFKISGVELSEGENKFTLQIEDKAGNKSTASKSIVVNYTLGDLNGDGQSTKADGTSTASGSTLPKSAGELSFLTDLFAMKGFIAIILLMGFSVFLFSTGFFAIKSIRRE